MTTTVLAYFPSPAQGVWHLGPVPIRAYALCIIAGIIAALLISDRRWAARGGERGVVYDVAVWAVPFGLIGGRLYHVMTDWKTYFGPGGAGLGAAVRIWEGGLGIWGAVALGGVGAWIACRRRGIPLPAFGDAVAPGIVLAQAIGRLGNYFNQELYGRETTVPWGMEVFYRRDASGMVDVHSLDGVSTGQVAAVVHPTFLYELLWNLLVFAILIYVDRKYRIGHGRLFALYVALYCLGRFWVELMRDDAATHIAGIRINVFTAMFVFIGAVVYMLLAPKGREAPASLRGKAVESAEHETIVEDLVAVAKGSGIIAAATVAGEHEREDAEAVGDLEETAEVAVGEVEDVVEAAEETVGDAVEIGTDDEMAAEADESTIVVYQSADEADTTLVIESGSGDESVTVVPAAAEAEAAAEAAIHAEAEAEIEAEIEAESEAEADVDSHTEAETLSDVENDVEEAMAVAEAEAAAEAAEVQAEAEAAAEAVAAADAESEAEAEDEAAEAEAAEAAEAVSDTGLEHESVDTETLPESAADASTADASTADALIAESNGEAEESEEKAPKLGSTFKRLLWGAGKRN